MEKYILKNGLKVIAEKNDVNELIYMSFFVKVGSRNENSIESGYSHLIEHMIYSMISKDCNGIACECNAITTREYTCYYAICMKSDFENILEIFTNIWNVDKIFNINIKKEIGIIKNEIRIQHNDMDYNLDNTLLKSVYGEEGLGNPISGKIDNLDLVDKNRLLQYYLKNYNTTNVVISIVGDLNLLIIDKFCEKIQKKIQFEKIQSKETKKQDMLRGNKITQILGYDIAKCVVALNGCSYKHEMELVYELCSVIIGGCNDSILYSYLRNEYGLVYNTYSEKISFDDSGIIYLYFDTDIKNFNKVIDKLATLFNEEFLRKVDNGLISKMKRQLAFNIQKKFSSYSAIMTEQGLAMLQNRKNRCTKEYIENIYNIGDDIVIKLLKQILIDYKKVVYALPEKESIYGIKQILFNNSII